jgi:hypothetical protein
MKGRGGFPHPYLEPEFVKLDNPEWEGQPDEKIFVNTVGVTSRKRDEPLGFSETELRVKIRDGWQCVHCGNPHSLRVHHKKGMKSHAMKDLETVCLDCHKSIHGYNNRLDGEPDAVKAASPVRREGQEKSHVATSV